MVGSHRAAILKSRETLRGHSSIDGGCLLDLYNLIFWIAEIHNQVEVICFVQIMFISFYITLRMHRMIFTVCCVLYSIMLDNEVFEGSLTASYSMSIVDEYVASIAHLLSKC